jgi:predicted MFS family arabinose efflux permease
VRRLAWKKNLMTDTISNRSRLWRNADFLKLWSAKTVSDFGSLVSRAALSFTAILFLKATPRQLSLLLMADLLPRFVIGLVAGVWVDRLRRRPLMILADIGRALLLGSIPAAALTGRLRIEHLYLVTLLTGMLSLIFDVADRSFLPTLVPSEHLIEANSKLTATASVAEFSAFSLAGWLVQWFTGPVAVLVDAVSFLFSALCLSFIRMPEPPPVPHEERESLRVELREGLSTVRRHSLLSALTVSTFLLGISGGIMGTVVVAFMARDLGFKPGILGMIWAIGGVTSLVGAMAAGPAARKFGVGRTMILGLFFSAAGGLAITFAHGATWPAAGLLIANQLITDPAHTLYDIHQMSLRQSIVPERLQGRVNATFEFIGLGATLLGALLGGQLGERLGLRTMITGGVMMGFLAALWLWLSPVRRIK